MVRNGVLLFFLFLFLTPSRAQNPLPGRIADPDKEVIFYHQSYKRNNYITPKGYDLVTIRFVIENKGEEDILIDFDDLHLIDDQDQLHRVEFLHWKNHDDNDKIFLEVKANSHKKRRVSFILPESRSLKGLQYKGVSTEFKSS